MIGFFGMSPWVDAATNRRLWRISGPMILANIAVPRRGAVDTAFAVFLSFVFGLSPQVRNHGLWLVFFLFLTLRGGILAVLYPALRRSLA